MANVSVDENILARDRTIAATVARIVAHPEGKRLLQQAQKTAIPESVIPELDAQNALKPQLDEIKNGFSALNKRLDDEAAARATQAEADKFQSDWNRQKSALRQQGFMDDFIDKIETHAQTEGIPNLRAAANDFLALNPPPAPSAPNGFGGWDFFGEGAEKDTFVEKMIEFRGDNDSLLNKEIAAALADVRQPQTMRR